MAFLKDAAGLDIRNDKRIPERGRNNITGAISITLEFTHGYHK